jgi:hypothetical protein
MAQTAVTSKLMIAVAAVAGLVLGATGAQAQSSGLLAPCQLHPCVRDSNLAIVGLSALVPGALLRPMNGRWYAMSFTDQGFNEDATFFYVGSQCETAPYFSVGTIDRAGVISKQLPLTAHRHKAQIWAPVGQITTIVYRSYSYGDPEFCVVPQAPGGFGPITVKPAVVLEQLQFRLPFQVD